MGKYLMAIGERLKEERERLGYNQADFAALAETTRKSQFNYETDERRPDVRYMAAIGAAGADVQYIVTGLRSSQALSQDEQQLIAAFRAAPLAVKGAVIGALNAGSKTPAPAPINQNVSGTANVASVGNVVNQGGKNVGAGKTKPKGKREK